ncbi:hypothetical protein I4F81_005720 [Pyropia yezoensis]|uniref:Uncharacterized protein n=1 Tax=Pyropia yezoensis TaxID=2788 RepID=A0ACC3BZX4_PYRYE|nr:hypothetical protein I4F81_005720 [Neopyropia yezoensis]
MGAARPPCQPLAAFAPPAGPVAVPALRSARLCCRARVEGAVAPPPPFRSAARAATVSSFASNGWAAGGGRARPRPMPAVGPPAAPSRCGARSLRAALVNKKGAGAEESLGIPSAPAESELAPLPSEEREKAAAAMDKMASDAVKQLTAEPPADDAHDDSGGGPIADAKAFLVAVRGEFAVVDWPETQRVAQILGFVVAAMVLSSVGIYAVDKAFMRLSSIVFGSEY